MPSPTEIFAAIQGDAFGAVIIATGILLLFVLAEVWKRWKQVPT